MKYVKRVCPTCTEEVNISWTERTDDRVDAFERIPCKHCNKGCVFIAEVAGVETTYRCCNCGK